MTGLSTFRSRGEEKAEPNVVPMIDVMLVLLIIFMVVTPFMAQGFSAEPPEAEHFSPRPDEPKDVVLGIDDAGNYFLNKRPITKETLPNELTRLYATRSDRVLYLKADKGLFYREVENAIDVASRSGIRVLGMITEKAPAPTERRER